MNLLFVIERYFPYTDASGKALFNMLTNSAFSEHRVHVVCSGNNDFVDNGVSIHAVNYKDAITYRIVNKINKKHFYKNKALISSFDNKIQDVVIHNNIDHIFFVCGNFNFLFNCLRVKIPFSLIYYDPFLNNYFYKNDKKEKQKTIERKAFNICRKVFMLNEYLDLYKNEYPESKDKMLSTNIVVPIKESVAVNHSKVLLHSGAFFKGLREPFAFFKFMELLYDFDCDYRAISLGFLPNNLLKIRVPINVSVINRVYGDAYKDLLSKSEILVVVDNNPICPQVPSKVFEYLSLNRKILLFTSAGTNTYSLLKDNKNTFIVFSDSIDKKTIENFLLFTKKSVSDELFKYAKHEPSAVARHILENIL